MATNKKGLINKQKNFGVYLFVSIMSLAIIGYYFIRPVFIVNESLPYYFGIAIRDYGQIQYKYNDVIMFSIPKNTYFQGNIIKEIKGLPGDFISQAYQEIGVNKLDLSTKNGVKTFSLLNKYSDGGVLDPMSNQHIPKGQYFVAGVHPKSYDSRYADFGLIKQSQIWGFVVVLF